MERGGPKISKHNEFFTPGEICKGKSVAVKLGPPKHRSGNQLLRSNHPSRKQSKVLYRWGVRRRRKTAKQEKVGVNRKWWVLVQPPYSPQRNGRQTQCGTRRMDHLTRRRNKVAGLVKGWEEKRDRGGIQIHLRKTRITRARTPGTPTIEPRIFPPRKSN